MVQNNLRCDRVFKKNTLSPLCPHSLEVRMSCFGCKKSLPFLNPPPKRVLYVKRNKYAPFPPGVGGSGDVPICVRREAGVDRPIQCVKVEQPAEAGVSGDFPSPSLTGRPWGHPGGRLGAGAQPRGHQR